jgi:DNA polymerase I
MALRGDSVDNIPGAPGIGDKGSVELIVEFGSVEAVLDRAARSSARAIASRWSRTGRRSCCRRNWSPSTAMCRWSWILAAMETQPPDLEACRELFTELEFTSMLRDLLLRRAGPWSSSSKNRPRAGCRILRRRARARFCLRARCQAAPAPERRKTKRRNRCRCWMWPRPPRSRPASALASAPSHGRALRLPLTPELRALLEDAAFPSDARLEVGAAPAHAQGIELRGAWTTRCCSPTR